MHEASLTSGLLDLALESLRNYNETHPLEKAKKITEITCAAGLLACFEANALIACFEIFAEGTPAEGAKLTVNVTPLECECETCGEKFSLTQRRFVCPKCGDDKLNFKGGSGLTLEAINVAREEKI